MSTEIIEYFSKLIKDEIGILYLKENQYQLTSRLEDICKQLKFDDLRSFFAEYKKLEKNQDPTLKNLVLDTATNNETKFFRDVNVFKALREVIEEKIDGGNKHIKIWSVACSTGQECYSVAMTLDDIKTKGREFNYSMIATDYSKRVLSQAKEGVYSQLQVQRGLNAMQLLQYFTQVGEGNYPNWKINDSLKKNITFKEVNLVKPWGMLEQFDIILCRNVLIYQDTQSRESILNKLYERLNETGCLFLGGSESMIGINNNYVLRRVSGSSVYQRLSVKKDAV